MSKNSEDMAPEETTYFPILDINSLLNFLDLCLFILFLGSYCSHGKWGLERTFTGSISLCPEENGHIYGKLSQPTWPLSSGGVGFFQAPVIPGAARVQGAEPRRGRGVTDPVPSQASCAIVPYRPAVRKQLCGSCLALSAVSRLARAGGLFACLLFDFSFPFVSTDVCSDVRQLFKGHLRMKSNFYSVIRINSSDVINQVNIYSIIQKNSSVTNLGIFSIRLMLTRLKNLMSYNSYV